MNGKSYGKSGIFPMKSYEIHGVIQGSVWKNMELPSGKSTKNCGTSLFSYVNQLDIGHVQQLCWITRGYMLFARKLKPRYGKQYEQQGKHHFGPDVSLVHGFYNFNGKSGWGSGEYLKRHRCRGTVGSTKVRDLPRRQLQLSFRSKSLVGWYWASFQTWMKGESAGDPCSWNHV